MSATRVFTGVAATAAALCLMACHPRSTARDVPAVITNPTEGSRAELARLVSLALNGASVTLADDALTGDSTLVVERTLRRDAQGRPLDGRKTGRPERFRLVKNGADCVLLHEGTDERWTLTSTTCAPR